MLIWGTIFFSLFIWDPAPKVHPTALLLFGGSRAEIAFGLRWVSANEN